MAIANNTKKHQRLFMYPRVTRLREYAYKAKEGTLFGTEKATVCHSRKLLNSL